MSGQRVLDEIVSTVMLGKSKMIEERLRVIVQPKPPWMPEFIWRRILRRLLYLEHS